MSTITFSDQMVLRFKHISELRCILLYLDSKAAIVAVIVHPILIAMTLSLHCKLSQTSYRLGGGETICPRQWQFDSRRIYVCPRTSPHSAVCTSLVVGQLQAASVPVA